MRPDAEARSKEVLAIKAELTELSRKFPDAFQKNIYFDEDGNPGPKSALYISSVGEEHVLLRPGGRLLRYTISMSVINTECYVPKVDNDGVLEDDDCFRFGQRAISILKARSQIGN